MENTNPGRILIAGRIKTPDGTVLTSRSVHDFQVHKDANGDTYFVDGGGDYMRTSVNKEPAEDISVYMDSPFEEIRDCETRLTVDKDGYAIRKKVSEMSDEHLKNCVTYNIDRGAGVGCVQNLIYMRELYYRMVNGISIPDDEWFKEKEEEDD